MDFENLMDDEEAAVDPQDSAAQAAAGTGHGTGVSDANGDKIDAGLKSDVETAIAETRTALEGDDSDAINAKAQALTELAMKMGQQIWKFVCLSTKFNAVTFTPPIRVTSSLRAFPALALAFGRGSIGIKSLHFIVLVPVFLVVAARARARR